MTDTFTLLRPTLPTWLERRVVEIASNSALAYDPADWRGALVVLEHGSIVLETLGGKRLRLLEGAALSLDGLSLLALRNEDDEAAVIALARRAAPLAQ